VARPRLEIKSEKIEAARISVLFYVSFLIVAEKFSEYPSDSRSELPFCGMEKTSKYHLRSEKIVTPLRRGRRLVTMSMLGRRPEKEAAYPTENPRLEKEESLLFLSRSITFRFFSWPNVSFDGSCR